MDPAGFADGMNLYAFVGNNPVNLIDPLGLAGIAIQLTDVKRVAELANALELTRGGTRLNVRGRITTISGPRGALLAGTRYLSDNTVVAQYINP